MNDSTTRERRYHLLRREGLAFLGAITASLSHELNNAIAIINEHNGLLNDLLAGGQHGIAIEDKKLERATKKIARQVERAQLLIKRLNRFAHSTDAEIREIDVNDMLKDIVELSQRLAGLRMVQLEVTPYREGIRVTSNPLFLQQAVFICFQLFWDDAENNRRVVVVPEPGGQGVKISITGSHIANSGAAQDKRALLEVLLEELHGTVEYLSDDRQNQSIVLSIPFVNSGYHSSNS